MFFILLVDQSVDLLGIVAVIFVVFMFDDVFVFVFLVFTVHVFYDLFLGIDFMFRLFGYMCICCCAVWLFCCILYVLSVSLLRVLADILRICPSPSLYTIDYPLLLSILSLL